MVSRGRGACASLRHLEERNCTSTVSKLSMTLTVSTPHPWPVGHFEGTDRSFAMYAAFPSSDYYGGSVAVRVASRRSILCFLVWYVIARVRSSTHPYSRTR